MADGRIIIDTEIDNSGVEEGLKKTVSSAKSQVAKLAAEYKKQGLSASEAFKKAWDEIEKDSEEKSKKTANNWKVNVGDKLSGIAKSGLKAITAASTALATMGAFAIKTGVDFESAFTGVKKTVDGSEQQLAQLETAVRSMAKIMPESASEIAGVAEAAGQLGIKIENIESFTKSMVMLGDSTNMSSEEAATALARLANITQMPQTQFDRLGSVIVALGNNLASTESEITSMALRLAGAGKQVGLTEAQIVSFAGALSSVGIEAEAGGSAFSKVMIDMQLAVEKGGDSLEAFANVAGMTSSEFQKAFKEDASSAINTFIKGLATSEERGVSAIKVLDDMGITEVRLRDALLRAAGAGDVFTDALKLGTDAWEENTALTKEAETRYATMESQLKILKNGLTDLGVSFYKEVNSPMAEIVKTANSMVDELSKAFSKDGFEGFVSQLGDTLATIIAQISSNAPKMIDLGVSLIKNLTTGIKNNLPAIATGAIGIVMSLVNGIVEMLPTLLEVGLQAIIALGQGIAENLPSLIPVIVNLIISICDMINDNLPMFIDVALDIIIALAEGLIDALPTLIAEIPRIINSFCDAIYDKLPDILKTGIEIIVMLVKGLIDSIPIIVKNLPQIIMAIVNVFTMMNWASIGKNLITNIGSGISSMVGNIGSIAKNLATNVVNAIKGIFTTNGGSIGRNLISFISNGISSMLSGVVSVARNIGTSVVNVFKNMFSMSSMAEIGKNLVKGIWNGISNMSGWIINLIGGFASSVIKSIKGFFGIHSPSRVMRDLIGTNIVKGIGVGIDVETPNLEKDIDANMSDLVAKMKGTVDYETTMTTARVISHNNSLSGGVEIDNTISKENPMTVIAKFIVDGKEFTQAVVAPNQDVLNEYYEGRLP